MEHQLLTLKKLSIKGLLQFFLLILLISPYCVNMRAQSVNKNNVNDVGISCLVDCTLAKQFKVKLSITGPDTISPPNFPSIICPC